jgi:hypothetical protein
MKHLLLSLSVAITLFSCNEQKSVETKPEETGIAGTWQLISSRKITKGDTAVTFDAKKLKMIKVLNATHFAFFQHDLNHGKDSASAVFSSGGGTYKLDGDKYSEHLEYCNYREWEGHDFTFTLTVKGDTIVQRGIEKIDSLNIDQEIIEEYVRIK